MREKLKFLKVSSVVIKAAAWIFLCLGALGGLTIILGAVPGNARWMGLVILAMYAFLFFFFYLVARMADLLAQIINEIEKEA